MAKKRRAKTNAGKGVFFKFHGSFKDKADAVAKERSTPGAFIKETRVKGQKRYTVMTERKDNPFAKSRKRKKKAKKQKPAPAAPKKQAKKKKAKKHKKNGSLTVAFLNKHKGKKAHIGKGRRAQRRNPEEDYDVAQQSVEEMFEDFHGEPAPHLTHLAEKVYAEDQFAKLGDLVELGFVQKGAKVDWDSKFPMLCSNGDGTQLYVFGGDQDFHDYARACKLDMDKETLDFGEVKYVVYRTQKGFDNFVDATYKHKFGEEGGARPRLMYDRLNKRIHFVGGDYTITDRGIED